MKNILIIQERIHHYRIPFFNQISKNNNLSVLSSSIREDFETVNFEVLNSKTVSFGPFIYLKNFKKITDEKYDIIVAPFDLRFFQLFIFVLFRKKINKWIWWGLDIGKSNTALKIKTAFSKLNNPIIFYHEKIMLDFVNFGLNKKKAYVANNSFYIPNRIESFKSNTKNCFVNVGSLDERKKNHDLITVFNDLVKITEKNIILYLIGTGEEEYNLKKLVSDLNLKRKVVFTGEINDPNQLSKYYLKSYASVSYGQAGLAVLQSMANGVPFITKQNAISGGEIHNINHKKNGILVTDSEDLKEWMVFCIENEDWVKNLGKNAYDYYSKECSINNMVNQFEKAFCYDK